MVVKLARRYSSSRATLQLLIGLSRGVLRLEFLHVNFEIICMTSLTCSQDHQIVHRPQKSVSETLTQLFKYFKQSLTKLTPSFDRVLILQRVIAGFSVTNLLVSNHWLLSLVILGICAYQMINSYYFFYIFTLSLNKIFHELTGARA